MAQVRYHLTLKRHSITSESRFWCMGINITEINGLERRKRGKDNWYGQDQGARAGAHSKVDWCVAHQLLLTRDAPPCTSNPRTIITHNYNREDLLFLIPTRFILVNEKSTIKVIKSLLTSTRHHHRPLSPLVQVRTPIYPNNNSRLSCTMSSRLGMRFAHQASRQSTTGFTTNIRSSIFRRFQGTAAPAAETVAPPPQSAFQRLWTSEVGIKTVHFWYA